MRYAVCALALCGCYSGAGLGRATTLPRGTTRVGGWIEASAVTAQLAGPITAPWGHLGLQVQRGVHERVELGARVSGGWLPWVDSLSVFGDVKVQLRRRSNGLDIAVAPSVGYHVARYGGTPWHVLNATTAMMFGYNLGRHQLVATVRGGYQLIGARGQERLHLGYAALSLGFVARVSEHWELIPEVLLGWSPVRFNGEVQDEGRVGAGIAQLAIGVARVW